MKDHGTKRVKRDHRGREKDLSNPGHQGRPRDPPSQADHRKSHPDPNVRMPALPRGGTKGRAEEKTEDPRAKNRRGNRNFKRPLEGRGSGQDC